MHNTHKTTNIMGACDFSCYAYGETPREAYREAVEEAQHEYGHDSYNGTISTTGGYKFVFGTPKFNTDEFWKWVDERSGRLKKWEDCICVDTGEREGKKHKYYFFGIASE